MMSSAYVESDGDNIPTGNIVAVKDTDYDFNQPTTIGQRQSNTEDKSLLEKKVLIIVSCSINLP